MKKIKLKDLDSSKEILSNEKLSQIVGGLSADGDTTSTGPTKTKPAFATTFKENESFDETEG